VQAPDRRVDQVDRGQTEQVDGAQIGQRKTVEIGEQADIDEFVAELSDKTRARMGLGWLPGKPEFGDTTLADAARQGIPAGNDRHPRNLRAAGGSLIIDCYRRITCLGQTFDAIDYPQRFRRGTDNFPSVSAISCRDKAKDKAVSTVQLINHACEICEWFGIERCSAA